VFRITPRNPPLKVAIAATTFVNPNAAVAPLQPPLAVINCKLSASTALEISVTTNLEVLEAEVLQLAPVERSHLLERLIVSLDSDYEVEEAWGREADRREAELESGSASAISGQDTIARLRARLQR
jgi:putative addiction module component (TIGR02574 family)